MGPGGAAGITQGEQPQGLGQPLPGAYSVEKPNDEVRDEELRSQEAEVYEQQYEEKKRTRRRNKLNLRGAYHQCGDNCNHATIPSAFANVPKPKSWFQKYAELELVEVGAGGHEVNEVPKLNQDTKFEVISVTVDSGAYNTVGPPKVGTYFNVTPTEASAQGKHYRAANGSVIRNHGQRVITGRTDEDTLVSMPIQVADVSKVLGSVREMVKAGNRVVFDEDSNGNCISFLECKATNVKTAIKERNGTCQFDIRVPKGRGGGVEEVTASNGSVTREGFPRQGTLVADLFH